MVLGLGDDSAVPVPPFFRFVPGMPVVQSRLACLVLGFFGSLLLSLPLLLRFFGSLLRPFGVLLRRP